MRLSEGEVAVIRDVFERSQAGAAGDEKVAIRVNEGVAALWETVLHQPQQAAALDIDGPVVNKQICDVADFYAPDGNLLIASAGNLNRAMRGPGDIGRQRAAMEEITADV